MSPMSNRVKQQILKFYEGTIIFLQMTLSRLKKVLFSESFADVFPISLSGLTYNQNITDVDYLTAEVTFKYQIYEIKTL